MHPFRKAVENGDLDAVAALLADDVVFTSPVAFEPYPGKAITTAILRAVTQVFENFTYVREIANPDGRDHAFVFTASVAGKKLQGCDFLHFDEGGKIDDFVIEPSCTRSRHRGRPKIENAARLPSRTPCGKDDGSRRSCSGSLPTLRSGWGSPTRRTPSSTAGCVRDSRNSAQQTKTSLPNSAPTAKPSSASSTN